MSRALNAALSTAGELGINLVGPALIYWLAAPRMGDMQALLLASAPPVVWSIAGLVLKRRIDALSMLVLAGIVLSLLAMLGGGSVTFLQLREKMVTALIGLVFLGSAAIGRPLVGALARATVAREGPEALARFEARRDHPQLRRALMIMTLVWGFGLLLDCAVSVVLIQVLSVGQYLVVGPVIGYGSMGGLTLWTVLYRRRMARQA